MLLRPCIVRLLFGWSFLLPAALLGQNGSFPKFTCLTQPQAVSRVAMSMEDPADPPSGRATRKTFRIAVAAAGEYTQFHGGTVEAGMQAIRATIDRVNQIYEPELGIHLKLVPNNHLVVFTDPATDPFSVNGATIETIDQCQATLDSYIGNSNYDVGIVFNTGNYGLAHLGVVCVSSLKGKACMGFSIPSGEAFALLVAHEMAHQFGANHTFNSPDGLCSGRRSTQSAVEPGAGSTMMSYAVVTCGDDSLQNSFDTYFHARSIQEVSAVLAGNACAETHPLGNRPPTVSAPSGFTIPAMTPFVLRGSAVDPDGDSLLYCWEQMDTGAAQTLAEADNGFSPLFRSFNPGTNSFRVFPRLGDLLANSPNPGERLPSTTRTMNFRLTVRDGVSTAYTSTQVFVTNSAPFRITSHNQATNCDGAQTITWDVAGTTNAPFNVQNVNILLSTNGGLDFTHGLATNVPNDGLQAVQFPPLTSTNLRFKVEAVENIFFDVNDAPLNSYQLGVTSVWAEGQDLLLRWPTRTGKQYRLEGTPDIAPASWSELSPVIVEFPGEIEARLTIGTNRALFLRVSEF